MTLRRLLASFAAVAVTLCAQAAQAVPKAAEDKDAPVTHSAAEAPKPKAAVQAAPPAKRKLAPQKRPAAKGKPAKKAGKARPARK